MPRSKLSTGGVPLNSPISRVVVVRKFCRKIPRSKPPVPTVSCETSPRRGRSGRKCHRSRLPAPQPQSQYRTATPSPRKSFRFRLVEHGDDFQFGAKIAVSPIEVSGVDIIRSPVTEDLQRGGASASLGKVPGNLVMSRLHSIYALAFLGWQSCFFLLEMAPQDLHR